MKEIVIASTNPAKISQIKEALKSVGIKADGPEIELPEVVEDGKTLLENATKKAMSAAKFLGLPVLAMDNGLFFDGLRDELQPGLNIRRIPGIEGRRPSDEELLEYYSKLIRTLGDRVGGFYRFGICVATPNGRIWTTEAVESRRIFTPNPCRGRTLGYPIESLSIDPNSGKYVAEMSEVEKSQFWQKAIGKTLGEFVRAIEI